MDMVGKVVAVKRRPGLWFLRSASTSQPGYWGVKVSKLRKGWKIEGMVRPIRPNDIKQVVYDKMESK